MILVIFTSTGCGLVIRVLHGAPPAGAVDARWREVAGCEGDIFPAADKLTGRWCCWLVAPTNPTCRPEAVVAVVAVAIAAAPPDVTGFCCTVNTTCVDAATKFEKRNIY